MDNTSEKNRTSHAIFYINYAPYENAGHILDFIKKRFSEVIVFSFNFHQLKKGEESNAIKIFKNGELVKRLSLFQIPTPSNINILFLLLPLRSFINFAQILFHVHRLRKNYKSPVAYFTVNAFTAWVGHILRRLRIVDKTIFWVWDYYPPIHDSKIITLMRKIYWQFDKVAITSDRLIFLNDRLIQLRKSLGVLPKNNNYKIVPIGTNPIKNIQQKKKIRPILGFIGVVKRSQGLDTVFETTPLLIKNYPLIRLDVVGSGPDELYLRKRAKTSSLPTNFYGYVPDEKRVENILRKFDIGLALYVPGTSNVSHFGDPSKIKDYLSNGIPVITTNVFQFSQEIIKFNAGIIVPYNSPEKLLEAIRKIVKNYYAYQLNALKLAKKYDYNSIYPKLFQD